MAILYLVRAAGFALASEGGAAASGAAAAAAPRGVEPREDEDWDGKRAASGIFGITLRAERLPCGRRAAAKLDFLASFADAFSDEDGSDLFLALLGVVSSSSSITYLEKEHAKRFRPEQFLQTHSNFKSCPKLLPPGANNLCIKTYMTQPANQYGNQK